LLGSISNLTSAVKLPGRIIAGLFLACLIALVLNALGILQLAAISGLVFPLIGLGAVLFGALSLTTICVLLSASGPFLRLGGLLYDRWSQHQKMTLLAARREIRRDEAKRERAEFEAKALARLDYLSAARTALRRHLSASKRAIIHRLGLQPTHQQPNYTGTRYVAGRNAPPGPLALYDRRLCVETSASAQG
jgi:hypothetical protein